VYIDSEYKGETPCVVNNLQAGSHILQLRHHTYPIWENEIHIKNGETVEITADLSENIIPKITLNGDGPGSYAIGDTIKISGTAETADGSAILRITQVSGDDPFYKKTYTIPIDDDFHYEYHLSTNTWDNGRYLLRAELSTGEYDSLFITILSESQTNAEIVKEIVENYHKTHTYSYADFFVCADMALDVWNMVKTQGINAKIVIGDVERSNEELFEANHAWVIAETSPGSWLALETTGGYTVPDNQEYYYGWHFESSRGFKTYLSLLEQYNAKLKEIQGAERRYNAKVSEYRSEATYLENLINSYNSHYAGRSLSPAEYQAATNFEAQIAAQRLIVARSSGEVNQATEDLNSLYSTLQVIMDKMIEQID
jgi:hypothetical protein